MQTIDDVIIIYIYIYTVYKNKKNIIYIYIYMYMYKCVSPFCGKTLALKCSRHRGGAQVVEPSPWRPFLDLKGYSSSP